MIRLKDFWQKIKAELLTDKDVVLALIVEKKGSAPRGVGAHMLILQDGTTVDTIGGGILEHLAVEKAKVNLVQKKSSIEDFSLNNKTAAQIGMVCGGQIKVLLQYLNKKDLPQIETAINLLENGQKFIVKIAWKNQMKEFDFTVLTKENKELKHKSSFEINADGGMYLEKFKQNPTVYLFGGGYVAQEVAKLLPDLEFDYCEPHTCDFNHELGEQNSQRI
ncbi:XdhC family protein [Megamonas hypermegale]|uniref:XdhC family protein n=1 Tax=Megamonas hypermegale TaxID=158847 RepID=UPI00195A32C6|nr:XdhC family protein [Megamonas hypermegale]MBM6833666.1 XdhC family protein [Megamonas hypermegale]